MPKKAEAKKQNGHPRQSVVGKPMSYYENDGALFRADDDTRTAEVFRPKTKTWEEYSDYSKLLYYASPITKAQADQEMKRQAIEFFRPAPDGTTVTQSGDTIVVGHPATGATAKQPAVNHAEVWKHALAIPPQPARPQAEDWSAAMQLKEIADKLGLATRDVLKIAQRTGCCRIRKLTPKAYQIDLNSLTASLRAKFGT